VNESREPHPDSPAADESWFRPPTKREHIIAAWLFVGFGIFFIAMFYLCYGWGFRWVILALGVYSIWHGLGHGRDAYRSKPQ
jgi:hypothetical protein